MATRIVINCLPSSLAKLQARWHNYYQSTYKADSNEVVGEFIIPDYFMGLFIKQSRELGATYEVAPEK